MKSVLIFFIVLLCFTLNAEDRFALVIGNGDYPQSPLNNTINDANDVSTRFTELGYNVTTVLNGNKQVMETAVYDITRKLNKGSMVVFYYAGHAAQVDQRNYLIPVGEEIKREIDLKYRCVDLGWILESFRDSLCKTYITILDSCRDNPYKNSSRSGERGLRVLNIPSLSDADIRNSAIIYATTEGNVALDGDGRNSPFTEAFLKYMMDPNETVLDIMTSVTNDVFKKTNSTQNPIMTNDFKEKVYFSKNREVVEESIITEKPTFDLKEELSVLITRKERITDDKNIIMHDIRSLEEQVNEHLKESKKRDSRVSLASGTNIASFIFYAAAGIGGALTVYYYTNYNTATDSDEILELRDATTISFTVSISSGLVGAVLSLITGSNSRNIKEYNEKLSMYNYQLDQKKDELTNLEKQETDLLKDIVLIKSDIDSVEE